MAKSKNWMSSPVPTVVKCPCGKNLRARPEFAGAEITCWSCHASVPVPIRVAPGDWVLKLLSMGARQLLEARTCSLLAMGAILVTLSLQIPHFGVWGAAIALALVMIGYGELMRRGSQGDWTSRPRVRGLMRPWRLLICLSAAIGLALPLVIAWGYRESPRVTVPGLCLAAVFCLLIPLIMLGTYAPIGMLHDRVNMVFATIRRHPVATLCSLLILPAGLLAVEFCLFEMIRWGNVFQFVTLDLFPLPSQVRIIGTVPHYVTTDFRAVPIETYVDAYFRALAHGYTFTGTIAASLALPVSNGIDPMCVFVRPGDYLYLRMFFTLFTVTCMLAALAVQARWLGLLSSLDSRRTAAEVACGSSSSTALVGYPNLHREQGFLA